MDLHHVQADHRQPREKFAKRRQRRPIPIVAATVLALAAIGGAPLGADHAELTTKFAHGIDVMVLVEDGEYQSAGILLGQLDLYEGEILVMHFGRSGNYAVMFVSTTPPRARTADEMVYRIGRFSMESFDGWWWDDEDIFAVAMETDAFLDMLAMGVGERLIYRIGDDTGTFEIPIPETIKTATEFFRRQVELHWSAEPSSSDQEEPGTVGG